MFSLSLTGASTRSHSFGLLCLMQLFLTAQQRLASLQAAISSLSFSYSSSVPRCTICLICSFHQRPHRCLSPDWNTDYLTPFLLAYLVTKCVSGVSAACLLSAAECKYVAFLERPHFIQSWAVVTDSTCIEYFIVIKQSSRLWHYSTRNQNPKGWCSKYLCKYLYTI